MTQAEKKIHKPTHLSSRYGLGLPNCTKTFQEISPSILLATEVWNEVKKTWSTEGTIIARLGYKWVTKWEEGKNHTIYKVYDNKENFVAIYSDIGSPIIKTSNGYEFYDWYLDVFQPAGEKPVLLDEDELEIAVKLGYLTEEQAEIAHNEAFQVMKELIDRFPDF